MWWHSRDVYLSIYNKDRIPYVGGAQQQIHIYLSVFLPEDHLSSGWGQSRDLDLCIHPSYLFINLSICKYRIPYVGGMAEIPIYLSTESDLMYPSNLIEPDLTESNISMYLSRNTESLIWDLKRDSNLSIYK